MTQPDLRAQLLDSVRLIKQLESALAERDNGGNAAEPIAIIGLGCRMPGGGNDPAQFWRVLSDGVDTVGNFPEERGDLTSLFDPNPDNPGSTYVQAGSFLNHPIDRFEPEVFGLSAREAVGMDPQQRLVLEVAWEALEHAGTAPDSLAGTSTGVFLGVSTTDYVRMRQERGQVTDVDAYQLMGEPSFTAGRLSHVLGLRGPSQVVDTACSSSLVALHNACQSLRSGECTTALAGGVNLMLSPYPFVLLSKFRGLAPDGRCKTFDAAADGYGRGEGAGVFVLKRLADAARDGDTVFAVMSGSAVGHDGRSSGMTVPNPAAQQEVIQAAIARAGLTPAEIDYTEAHGTGTSLGDPIELRAMAAALGRERPASSPLLVGSVKTNVGHLEAAAGAAGLLKLVLALWHREIPPHRNLTELNPRVDWETLPVRVVDQRRPWPVRGTVRAGSLSSFGASGTNVHAVISEAPPAKRPRTTPKPFEVLVLSARTERSLLRSVAAFADLLRSPAAPDLPDVCRTTQSGRSRMARGLVVTGTDPAAMAAALGTVGTELRDEAVTPVTVAPARLRRTAWLFTGQGAQYGQMAEQLREEPAYAEAIDRVAVVMDPLLERPLAEVLSLPDSDDSPLHRTEWTQPALFAVEYALASMWLARGLRPTAVAGHSVGEITAACVAGVLDLDSAVRLVVTRGRLMGELPHDGGMATVVCNEERAQRAVAATGGTVVAAVNGPTDTVLAGPAAELNAVLESLKAEGVRHRRLRVSHAFHSPLMSPAVDRLRGVTEGLAHGEPRIRLVSTVTGVDWGADEADPAYWLRQALAPVRFHDAMQLLHSDGVGTYLEVGPHPVLLGLGARSVDDPDCAWIPSMRKDRDPRRTVAHATGVLHLRGQPVDWAATRGGAGFTRVPLPTYQWDRGQYWFRERTSASADPVESADDDRPGDLETGRMTRVNTAVPTYRFASPAAQPDETIGDLPALVTAATAAAADALGGLWPTVVTATLEETVAPGAILEVTVEPEDASQARFAVRGRTPEEAKADAPWRGHARGILSRSIGVPPVGTSRGGTELDGTPVAGRPLLAAAAAAVRISDGEVLSGVDGLAIVPGAQPEAVRSGHTICVEGTAPAAVFCTGAGAVAGWVERMHHRPASALGGGARWRDPAELVLALDWPAIESPTSADVSGEHWLLVADAGGVAVRLAEALMTRGARGTVVDPGDGAQLRDALGSAGHLDRVVILRGLDTPGGQTPDDLIAMRDRAELVAIVAMQTLADAPPGVATRLYLVTAGAVAAAADQSGHAPAAAGLWGLARVFALEQPAQWGGAVDLDPDRSVLDPNRLLDALAAGPAEDQTALRRDQVLVCRLVPRPLVATQRPVPLLRRDGTYLVSGAFGGIGTAVCRWLAEQGAGRIVMLTRSAVNTPERAEQVRTLREFGVRVDTVCADVADEGAVATVVDDLCDGDGPPLRGVIHAAGVSCPERVTEVTEDGYDAVWRPKVLGGWALHQATRHLDLDLFLGFSSVAATWGSMYLAGYAAANAALDGLAHHRANLGLAALSVNWGQWDLSSYLYDSSVDAFLAGSGLRRLPAAQALRLLGRLLDTDRVQPVVCAADWRIYREVLESRGSRPMLAGMGDAADDAKPEDDAIPPLLDTLSRQTAAERTNTIASWLRDQLAQVLGVDRGRLDGEYQLMELGIDSLMVMELVGRVRGALAVSPAAADFFATDAADWDQLVLRHVLREHDLDTDVTTTAGAAR